MKQEKGKGRRGEMLRGELLLLLLLLLWLSLSLSLLLLLLLLLEAKRGRRKQPPPTRAVADVNSTYPPVCLVPESEA